MIENYDKIACCFTDKVNKTYEAKRYGISCHIEDINQNNQEAFELSLLMDVVEYINSVELQEVDIETECNKELIKEKVNIL